MRYLTKDVFEGRDGRLFLAGGANEALHFFSLDAESINAKITEWANRLRLRKMEAHAIGADYRHVIIPDKLNVYREEADCDDLDLRFPARVLETDAKLHGVNGILIPLTEYFRRQKQRYPMYYLTDTHCTTEGCFSAYQMICFYLGVAPRDDLISRVCARIEMSLDLGGKLNPPRKETLSVGQYGRGAVRVFANDLVTLRERKVIPNNVALHNGSMVAYENKSKAAADISLLVFGDSFFEYRTHLLTGMFAETVRRITFVWSPHVDWKLARSIKPDVILTECAERFMTRCPDDTMDIEAHVAKKLAALSLDQRDA